MEGTWRWKWARDSVQGARYEALGDAWLACGVPELSKSILEIVPGAYGEAKKALHFLPACASESMERVVEAARAELEVRRAERRSAGAEGAPASERRSTGGSGAWVAVVICAGWNCNEVENLQEAFVVKQLCETQTCPDTPRNSPTSDQTGAASAESLPHLPRMDHA